MGGEREGGVRDEDRDVDSAELSPLVGQWTAPFMMAEVGHTLPPPYPQPTLLNLTPTFDVKHAIHTIGTSRNNRAKPDQLHQPLPLHHPTRPSSTRESCAAHASCSRPRAS